MELYCCRNVRQTTSRVNKTCPGSTDVGDKVGTTDRLKIPVGIKETKLFVLTALITIHHESKKSQFGMTVVSWPVAPQTLVFVEQQRTTDCGSAAWKHVRNCVL